ncbi:hypothetical protein ECAI27_28640 [Escherichia coli AI27]|nr:hypothetical protein ECAI27_28640 [Escherichia coli AI27]
MLGNIALYLAALVITAVITVGVTANISCFLEGVVAAG